MSVALKNLITWAVSGREESKYFRDGFTTSIEQQVTFQII